MGLKGSCSFFEAYRLLWWVRKAALGGRRPDPVLELFRLLGGQGELACVGGAPGRAATQEHGLWLRLPWSSPSRCARGSDLLIWFKKRKKEPPASSHWVWTLSRREVGGDRDLGKRDFLPGFSACGHTDQFLILRSAGHWVRQCVHQMSPPVSYHVTHSFQPLSLNYCLLSFCLSFFPPEMVRTHVRMKLVYPC